MVDKTGQQRRHLGRGLEALIGPITKLANQTSSAQDEVEARNFPPDKDLQKSMRQVLIEAVKPNPYQPRTSYNDEDIRELAESIRVKGVIQPILVREQDAGFELIAGERRLRAARLAGLEDIPALVREADDVEMLELALIENIHRNDLNPIDRALAYQKYLISFSLTQSEAAQRLGEDRSVIANYLRLLDLPEEITLMLVDERLSMGHARAILALPTDDLRRKLAARVLAGHLSVREVERLVRRALSGSAEGKVKVSETPAHILDLERKLQDVLSTKVTISTGKRGHRGKIIIDFYSLDEFDRLTEKMGLIRTETV